MVVNKIDLNKKCTFITYTISYIQYNIEFS